MRRGAVIVLAALAVTLSACSGDAVSPTSTTPSGRSGTSGSSSATAPAFPSSAPVVSPSSPSGTSVASRDPVVDGIDWSTPSWVRPTPGSGFFSEEASAEDHIDVRSVDLSWRQLQPRKGPVVDTEEGNAQGIALMPLRDQLADEGPFWVRIFASGVDWAPQWVATECKVRPFKAADDGEQHLPIWDDCVWGHLLALYREVFVTRGLRADPRLRFVWVPGAFTWAEYDYETVNDAFATKALTTARYLAWYSHAWKDLAEVFGPYRTKLVFTGEDYPWSEPLGARVATLAKEATDAGIGIRNGIPELFNFHLNEAPAYGAHIQPDGHVTVEESLPIHDGARVIGMENECFTDCGFTMDDKDVPYAVVQTNLKSLQLRASWVYVVPTQSRLAPLRSHWEWVRLSLGKTAVTSPDAWADLRDAEDRYWVDNDLPPFNRAGTWRTKPWVRNVERWLVQRDVAGGRAHRSNVDIRSELMDKDNGTAHEGLSTAVGQGDSAIYLDLDNRFVSTTRGSVEVKVTYWGREGGFVVLAGNGARAAVAAQPGAGWHTATVTLPISAMNGSLAGTTDLAVRPGDGKDIVVRFVRVVRTQPPVPTP